MNFDLEVQIIHRQHDVAYAYSKQLNAGRAECLRNITYMQFLSFWNRYGGDSWNLFIKEDKETFTRQSIPLPLMTCRLNEHGYWRGFLRICWLLSQQYVWRLHSLNEGAVCWSTLVESNRSIGYFAIHFALAVKVWRPRHIKTRFYFIESPMTTLLYH